MAVADLADLHTHCRVALAVVGIPPVADRQVGRGRAGHFDKAQERELVILPELHCAGYRKEGWKGSSPRNWRGTVLGFR